jgi:3-hydroxy-9,10-secoandrosta-1,3,5(10)-triene-9,17-dione monooxygenase
MDHEAILKQAAQLVPVLTQRASQADTLRTIPPETVDDLTSGDLLRLSIPERFGGLGSEFDVVPQVVSALGRGCGSTAWCYAVWASCNLVVGTFPKEAQEEYWSTGIQTLCAAIWNPSQSKSLTATSGGYRLSGRWDFASGCDAARWILVMGMSPSGPLMMLLPRADCTIVDTWFASGLKGTGSKDIVIEEAWIPEHRVLPVRAIQEAEAPGRWIDPSVNYQIPAFLLTGYTLSASIIGMAGGAVQTFRQSMTDQTAPMRSGAMAQLAGVQMRLAEASLEVEAAQLLVQHDLSNIFSRARRGDVPTVEQRLQSRCCQAYVATLGVRAVDRLFAAAAGRALQESNTLQRFYRDAHAASHHAGLSWDILSEQYGRVLLGLDPTYMRF